jgi:hypothetical protein
MLDLLGVAPGSLDWDPALDAGSGAVLILDLLKLAKLIFLVSQRTWVVLEASKDSESMRAVETFCLRE